MDTATTPTVLCQIPALRPLELLQSMCMDAPTATATA
jgi:hypothetical protein